MSERRAFTKADFDAVAAWAAKGVRLALVAKPDGTRVVMAAADVPAAESDDFDARLDAFGAS